MLSIFWYAKEYLHLLIIRDNLISIVNHQLCHIVTLMWILQRMFPIQVPILLLALGPSNQIMLVSLNILVLSVNNNLPQSFLLILLHHLPFVLLIHLNFTIWILILIFGITKRAQEITCYGCPPYPCEVSPFWTVKNLLFGVVIMKASLLFILRPARSLLLYRGGGGGSSGS